MWGRARADDGGAALHKAAVRCRGAEVSVARKLPSVGLRRNIAVDALRDGSHEQLSAYYDAQLAEDCAHFDRLSRRPNLVVRCYVV